MRTEGELGPHTQSHLSDNSVVNLMRTRARSGDRVQSQSHPQVLSRQQA